MPPAPDGVIPHVRWILHQSHQWLRYKDLYLKWEMGWKLWNITITYVLKTVGDPHEAGKLLMDSPHEAAVDSWHPHKATIMICQKWIIVKSHQNIWITLGGIFDTFGLIGIRIRKMLHTTIHHISIKCHQLLFQWYVTNGSKCDTNCMWNVYYFSLISDLDIKICIKNCQWDVKGSYETYHYIFIENCGRSTLVW